MSKAPVRLSDLFRYYRGEPHQLAAIELLGRQIPQELLGRDQEWFGVWSQAGKTQEPPWLAPATKIIKEFEGCRLVAYLCPAGVWTVGWGLTQIDGRPVRQGDTVTQTQADAMLRNEIEHVAAGVLKALQVASGWTGDRVAALTSFAFNVGLGALQESTLRARLLDREDPNTVIREELPRWNKAGGKPLDGLTRRRAAEVALFVGKSSPVEIQQQPAKLSPASPFSAHITPNIQLGEFALDQEERRFHHQYQVDTAAELAAFLERVRRNFGTKPIIITSGYRPAAINRMVGGASSSEHLFDAPNVGAVDFYVGGTDIYKVQAFCDKYWDYSVGYGAPKGFVHLGIRRGRPRVRWDY